MATDRAPAEGGDSGVPVGAYRRSVGKLAEQVALRIEDDVRAAGWPVGANLGSETDLLGRYGVSRAVLREAVSLAEYLGVARMRRGPGGGLFVTEPDPSAVVAAVSIYMVYRSVDLEEIMQARRCVEQLTARLAAERHTESHLRAILDRLAVEASDPMADHAVLHQLVARATGNPALELFVDILSRITNQFQTVGEPARRRRRTHSAEVTSAHQLLVEAIERRDPDGAARRMSQHLDALQSFFSSRRVERALTFGDDPVVSGGEKLAATVARRLFADIVGLGWPVGHLLGSEPDLMERYDVGRAVVREANRLLEFHRVIRTQRGVHGGIFVSAPDEMATTDALAVYLDAREVTAAQLFEVREAIELESVEFAATRLDKYAIGLLTETLVDEMSMPSTSIGVSGHLLHLRIAELAGNQAILLLLNALTRLTQHHQIGPSEGLPMTYDEAAESVSRTHASIVKAIAAGDPLAARRRMQRHLRAVPPLLR